MILLPFSKKASRQFALASLILGTMTQLSQGQSTPSAIDQLNGNLQNRNLDKQARSTVSGTNSAPELYPGENDDVGPQSILATKPRPPLFDVSADVQYYFSDNALLDHDSRQSSGILISTIQAAFAPQAYSLWGGQASPRIGVRQQWYNFLEYKTEAPNLNSYDFINQTFFVDERWTKNGWTLGGGMDATRLTSMQGNKQFYGEFQPRWEVDKLFEVGRKANLVLSYQGNIHFSHTPFPVELGPPPANYYDRMESLGQLSLVINPCQYAIIQPYYSLRYTSYKVEQNREDKLNTVGLSVYWFATDHITMRTFLSFDKRFSNVTQGEYSQFSSGLGLNVDIRF